MDLKEEFLKNQFNAEFLKDITDNIKKYQKLAEEGNPQAQYLMGCAYLQGFGVTQSYVDAVK